MKKGFTLIELLAVISIIAIIALVTTPLVIGVINSSRQRAFISTAHGLVVSAGTYQAQRQALNEDSTLLINYKTSSDEEKNLLKTDGDLPDAGELMIDENGKVTLALWSNEAHICVVKKASDKSAFVDGKINNPDKCVLASIEE